MLDAGDLAGGFEFSGDRIPLINSQRGIFKPRQMEHLLFHTNGVSQARWAGGTTISARRTNKSTRGKCCRIRIHGHDPNSPDNRWLLDAMQPQIPIIYFLGTSPGRYQPIISTFIVGWHPERLQV